MSSSSFSSTLKHLFSSPRHQVLPFLVGTHLSLSLLSLVNSQLLPSQYQFELNDKDDDEECFDAGHYRLVQDFVGRLYRGELDEEEVEEKTSAKSSKGAVAVGTLTGYRYKINNHNSNLSNNSRATSHHPAIQGIRLAPTATMEDPAAVCCGMEEIREAFRALRVGLHPQTVSPPRCIHVEPKGEQILLTYALHQQYTLPWYGTLTLRSTLHVAVQLQPIPELAESEFWVLSMTELWDSRPLAWPYFLYYPSRRLNGMLSYRLTSWWLPKVVL